MSCRTTNSLRFCNAWQEKLITYRLKRTSAKTNRPPEMKSGGRSNSNSKGDASKAKAGSSSKKKLAARQPESVAAAAPVEGAGKKGPGRQGLSEELRSVQQDLQFSNMVLPPPVAQSAPTQGAASGPPAAGNKTQRLQRLLAETEKKRKRLQVRLPRRPLHPSMPNLLLLLGAEQGSHSAGHQAAQEHSVERRHQSSCW